MVCPACGAKVVLPLEMVQVVVADEIHDPDGRIRAMSLTAELNARGHHICARDDTVG